MSDHAAIVRKAHADAMMALAADVHPYTQSSIDAHEQAMDDALDALVKERDEQRSLSHEHYEAYVSEVALRQAAEEKAARMTDERNDARYVVKAAEAERDRWRAVACNVKDGTAAAEARVTELEAAYETVVKERDSWRILAEGWKLTNDVEHQGDNQSK